MIVAFDYASPSALVAQRERAALSFAADRARPVRFHARVRRHVLLLRFALRALGGAIWSDDAWLGDGERGAVLDPVVTVHPDVVLFEAFSQDGGASLSLALERELFEPEGEVVCGTTNVDFTAWLWGALGELRSSRETWLRLGPEGFEVETVGAGGRFEPRVELPDAWVRGFLQAGAAMALPGLRLEAEPVDLLAAIRYLRHTKAKLSPRALRYELLPGEDATLVLEPWEHGVRLHGATHGLTEPRTIRVWGRRRLALLEPLLPFAERVEIFLKGRGLPSFYAVHLPGMIFTLGLSSAGERGFSGANFDVPTAGPSALDPAFEGRVLAALQAQRTAAPAALAAQLEVAPAEVWRACEGLVRQGRAVFDVRTRAFRQRDLFARPLDLARIFPPDERLEEAERLVAARRVVVQSCALEETTRVRRLPSPEGPVTRELVFRDWHIDGQVLPGGEPVQVVVNEADRVIFGRCECRHFREHLLSQGPCAHMLALHRVSAEARREGPSSRPAASAPPPLPRAAEEIDEPEEEDGNAP
ncbi:MAG: hypothetical protein JSR82_04870 [Verrucomicrobia bacterium]|nr:hypothetical protein [Verrucomicrobiota bacterium]